MKNYFTWKKKFFSETYRIFEKEAQIGIFKNRPFSSTSEAEINGKKYSFKTKGFFQQHTEIMDGMDGSLIGEIRYGSWKTRATITLNNKTYSWKYDNIWSTRWSLTDGSTVHLNFAGSSTSGKVESNTDDYLLLLLGLYVMNYFWQATIIVLIAVFLPIWLSSAH